MRAGGTFFSLFRKDLSCLRKPFAGVPGRFVVYGNLSSPFVFFVLEKALRENAPGGLWWMASFGAGFSSHGSLMEVE